MFLLGASLPKTVVVSSIILYIYSAPLQSLPNGELYYLYQYSPTNQCTSLQERQLFSVVAKATVTLQFYLVKTLVS